MRCIYIYIARFKGCYLELYFLQNDNTTGKWKLSLENDHGILYVLPGRDEGYFWPYRVQRRAENSVQIGPFEAEATFAC